MPEQEILELMRGYTLWHPSQAAASDMRDALDSESVEKHLRVLGWNDDAGSRVARLEFFGITAEKVQPEFREPATKASQPRSLLLNASSASSRSFLQGEPRKVTDLRNGADGIARSNEASVTTQRTSLATEVR